jgi:hypothetical protein
MRNLKIILSILVLVLLAFQTVKAVGVTQPILEKRTMLRGENSKFYFEIQTIGYSNKQSCTWSISGLDPLQVNFNETHVIANVDTIRKVYGTIFVPSNAPQKTYSGSLSVTCEPYVELEGGSSIKRTNNVPFVVGVVENLEKRAEQKLPEPEKQKPTINLLPMLVIIILVVLVISLVYWFNKKKK